MPQWATFAVVLIILGSFLLLGQAFNFYLRAEREREEYWLQRRLGLIGHKEDDEFESSLIREQAADSAVSMLGEYGLLIKQTIAASGSDMTVTALVMRMGLACLCVGMPASLLMGGIGIPVGIIAGYAPYRYLQSQGMKRMNELLSQMPDSLELMSRSMQAGVGLGDSFRLVAEEMPLPIAQEWGRVYEEIRFGKEWRHTLAHLIDRNPLIFDLRLLVSSILLQRDIGGNLIEVLTKISITIRNRYLFDAKVLAMTSEARTSALVMAMMPMAVAVLIVFTNPSYLVPLWTDPWGKVMLLYCVSSYTLGLYAMRNASNVEV
jgi:tight adherence protein B